MNRIITYQPVQQAIQLNSYEKGSLFEEYIISLFNQKHFKVKEWRKSERFFDNVIPYGHCLPDFELIFMGKREHNFAVECKWKKEFKNGKIQWADQTKIDIYKKFQKERKLIVFVAIGIGGHPSNPNKLFVTPLDKICMYTEVTENDLMKYNRKPTNRFFYDTIQLRLW